MTSLAEEPAASLDLVKSPVALVRFNVEQCKKRERQFASPVSRMTQPPGSHSTRNVLDRQKLCNQTAFGFGPCSLYKST